MDINQALSMLGYPGRDRVTGFKGVVTSISFELYGCVQAAVSPSVDEKGVIPEGRWFDLSRLEIIGARVMPPVGFFETVPTGGDSRKPAPRG